MKVHSGSREKFPLMAEINMIPLIDVSLVLLIIFMVITPFLVTSQIKINLPKAVTGIAADATPVKIQITARKTFYVDGQSVSESDLAGVLRAKLSGEKSPVALIEADASVPVDALVKAMDTAKAQGAQKLGVAVSQSAP
jgi:biopolymer transport protein ExbD